MAGPRWMYGAVGSFCMPCCVAACPLMMKTSPTYSRRSKEASTTCQATCPQELGTSYPACCLWTPSNALPFQRSGGQLCCANCHTVSNGIPESHRKDRRRTSQSSHARNRWCDACFTQITADRKHTCLLCHHLLLATARTQASIVVSVQFVYYQPIAGSRYKSLIEILHQLLLTLLSIWVHGARLLTGCFQ